LQILYLYSDYLTQYASNINKTIQSNLEDTHHTKKTHVK
jgi:hypothetical protein